MRTFSYLFSFLLTISICFSSCQEDEVVDNNLSKVESEYFTLYATYRGVDYEVPCELIEDSIIFLDNEFSDLFHNEISQLSDLNIFCHEDGSIEYFGSETAMLRSSGVEILKLEEGADYNNLKAVGEPSGAEAILWDDTNFRDRSIAIYASSSIKTSVSHLKPTYGFNDKASSLKVFCHENRPHAENKTYCAVFYGYEDNDLQWSKNMLCCDKRTTS